MTLTPIAPVVCPKCGTSFDPKLDLRYCGTCGADLSPVSLPPISIPSSSFDEASRDTLRAKDPLLGEILDNRYKILESIGQGGMGKVYLVEHQQMSKKMAMKLLHRELANNRDVARRFRREALAISRLTSPHTVQVFDFGQGAFGMYLVMELLRGEDLGKIIHREEKISLLRTIDFLSQAATALEEAHAQGIVHRDLKPENLFITHAHNGNEHLKILDFGLAKLQSSANEETGHGRLLGTPYYMSPEQIRGGDVDARADIYAIGALFHKMLTGEPPYKSETPLGVLSRHVSDPIPKLRDKLPGIHSGAQRLLDTLLAKDPNKRPKDVREVKRMLQALASESETPSAPEPEPEESPAPALPLVESGLATRADWEDFAFRQQRRKRLSTFFPFLLIGAAAGVAYYYRDKIFPPPDNGLEEKEPNNDYRNATLITPGKPIKGFLGKRLDEQSPDRDLYKINFEKAGPHQLDIDCSGISNINLRLDTAIIVDGEAKLMEPFGDSFGKGGAESLSINLVASSAYIVVRQIKYGDTVIENVSDPYELNVKVSAGLQEPKTPPDPFTTPKAISSGLTVEGYINSRFSFDVYRLTTPGKRISIRLDPIAGVDASLELYSAEKKLLQTSDATRENQVESIDSASIPEGEPPFIVVRKKGGQSEGTSYTITATIK
jgi:tRNA A-37 threonylcarbamoyl transferase component Bud32